MVIRKKGKIAAEQKSFEMAGTKFKNKFIIMIIVAQFLSIITAFGDNDIDAFQNSSFVISPEDKNTPNPSAIYTVIIQGKIVSISESRSFTILIDKVLQGYGLDGLGGFKLVPGATVYTTSTYSSYPSIVLGDCVEVKGTWFTTDSPPIYLGGTGSYVNKITCPGSRISVFRNGGWFFDSDGDRIWSTGDTTGWFGTSGDLPVAGDWDGNGNDEIAVFRNGGWYFDADGCGYWCTGDTTGWFGTTGDKPAAGDWDNNGKDEIAVFRNGGWYFDANGDGHWSAGDTTGWFGTTGDLPVAGDWDGDDKDEIAVFRNGGWYFDANGDGHWSAGDTTGWFGTTGDLPAAGDWDNNGKDEIAVFRNGGWYFDTNGDRYWSTGDTTGWFGTGGDRPVAGQWRSPLSSSMLDHDKPRLDLDQKVEPSEKIRQKRVALEELEEECRDQAREIKISQESRQ